MGKRYYIRLARENIRRNARLYIPYTVTSVLTAAMLYIIVSLSNNPDIRLMPRGSRSIPTIMTFGTYVTMIFAFIFLFYTNSFIMKRRRKEFGLLNILGMEKRHIARLLLTESVYTVVITLVGGLLIGVLLDKLMFLLLTRMIGESAVLGFHFSAEGALISAGFMLGTFFLIYLNMLRQIHLAKPVELLSGTNAGEREPKSKLIPALLGAVLLAAGYFIAIVTEEPVKAIQLFFVAVVCVILGTYLLFYSGSVVWLKALRRRKSFYYRAHHFTAVSGLIYRMKRNAVGLASVCILSTMVLVMVSTTTALVIGVNEIIDVSYPRDVSVRMHSISKADAFEQMVRREMEIKNVGRSTMLQGYFMGDPAAPRMLTEEEYDWNEEYEYYSMTDEASANAMSVTVTELDQINRERVPEGLEAIPPAPEGTVTLVTINSSFTPETVTMLGRAFKVGNVVPVGDSSSYHPDGFTLVFNERSEEMLSLINDYQSRAVTEGYLVEQLTFDYAASDKEAGDAAFDELFSRNFDVDIYGNLWYDFRTEAKADAMSVFGSLFFLGLFLGTLFLMETVLIIYYKQVSEGYEDAGRFEIMQNVGMSRSEVRRSIRSQILIVFFLPLMTAGMHIMFAFPLIRRLLFLLELKNASLYAVCTAVSFAAFALFYGIIYLLTARTYYRIVRK